MKACTGRSATEFCARGPCNAGPSEHRNHLLPHLRRQRHRGHRAGHGAGRPRPRSPLHHLRQPHSPGPRHTADSLPRGGSLHLSAVPVPALLPGAGLAHGGSSGVLRLDLLHVHYAIPHSIPPCWRSRCWPPSAACRSSPPCTARISPWWASDRLLLPHHQVFHRAVRRRHRHQRVPARPDRRGVRHRPADPSHPKLRQLRDVSPRRRPRRAPPPTPPAARNSCSTFRISAP